MKQIFIGSFNLKIKQFEINFKFILILIKFMTLKAGLLFILTSRFGDELFFDILSEKGRRLVEKKVELSVK